MNRAMRRQMSRKGYSRTEKAGALMAMERHERKIRKKEDDLEIELYFTLFGIAMTELYGWKKTGIAKIWKYADDLKTELVDGKTTIDELKQRLRDKADIECSFE